MREAVRVALDSIAARFSDDAPSVDEKVLHKRYPAISVWPSDAELGLSVLAWILGSGFSMGEFGRCCNALVPDFERARETVSLGTNPTLVTLNGIIRCALGNGATVLKWNLNPEILYWPLDLARCAAASGAKSR